MNYQQLLQPNLGVIGQAGLCLEYVSEVFGVPEYYPSATVAWANCKYPHSNQNPPTDVSVPVWFSYNGPDGHVAVSIPNQGIYSTSAQGDKIFGSINELISWMGEGMTYLGWSEDINNVSIVKEGVNNMLDNAGIIAMYQIGFGRSPSSDEIATWVGKDYHELEQSIQANNSVQQNAIANFANVEAENAKLQAGSTKLAPGLYEV